MIPIRNNSHVTEALDRLTSMFKGRPVIEGMIASYVNRLQALESALWDVILSRTIETTNDAALDGIGSIVGEIRNGRSNDAYREAIRLRILINRSQGKRAQLLKIIALASKASTWYYSDLYPAGFAVFFGGTLEALKALAVALKEAKSAGIEGGLYYTDTPLDEMFVYGTPDNVPTFPFPPLGYTHTSPDVDAPNSVFVHVEPLYFT